MSVELIKYNNSVDCDLLRQIVIHRLILESEYIIMGYRYDEYNLVMQYMKKNPNAMGGIFESIKNNFYKTSHIFTYHCR